MTVVSISRKKICEAIDGNQKMRIQEKSLHAAFAEEFGSEALYYFWW